MEPLRSMAGGLLEWRAAVGAGAGKGARGLPALLGLGQSVAADLLLSLAVLATGFFAVREPGMSRKRQAWILSALTSLPAATLSLSHVQRLLRHWSSDVSPLVFTDDPLARFLCTYFLAFLLLDLALGLRFYRDEIKLLSGWVHHALYILLMAWALTCHFACGFVLFLPLELPTFVLALGSIFPERRSDLFFGLSFFCTRVLYHAVLLQRILRMQDAPYPVWIPTLLAFALHVYWFALWTKSYARRRARLEQDKSAVVPGASAVAIASPVGAGASPTSAAAAAAAAAARHKGKAR